MLYNLYFGVQPKDSPCQEHEGVLPSRERIQTWQQSPDFEPCPPTSFKQKVWLEHDTLNPKQQSNCCVLAVSILQSAETGGHRVICYGGLGVSNPNIKSYPEKSDFSSTYCLVLKRQNVKYAVLGGLEIVKNPHVQTRSYFYVIL